MPVVTPGGSTGEMANAAPTVVATVDLTAACGEAGVTRVELQGTRVACIDPPPAPCTVPNPPRPTLGTSVMCPAASSPMELQVELTAEGRYHVEVVSWAGTTEQSRVCWGETDDVEVLITEARINGKPTIEVMELDGEPCMP